MNDEDDNTLGPRAERTGDAVTNAAGVARGASHTPGPWSAKPLIDPPAWGVQTPEQYICEIPERFTFTNAAANARLIAAAPDLLAACEAILHVNAHGWTHAEAKRALALCEAAVARVRGTTAAHPETAERAGNAPPSNQKQFESINQEMLSALKQVEAWWLRDGHEQFLGAPAAIFNTRAAIAKAEGRS